MYKQLYVEQMLPEYSSDPKILLEALEKENQEVDALESLRDRTRLQASQRYISNNLVIEFPKIAMVLYDRYSPLDEDQLRAIFACTDWSYPFAPGRFSDFLYHHSETPLDLLRDLANTVNNRDILECLATYSRLDEGTRVLARLRAGALE